MSEITKSRFYNKLHSGWLIINQDGEKYLKVKCLLDKLGIKT